MKTKTLENVRARIEHFKSFVKPTIDNIGQFERNIRYGFALETLGHLEKNLQKHLYFIGKKVWKFKTSFNYSEVENPNILNKTEPQEVLFTEELFKEFEKEYIKFLIEYHISDLVERKITSNSTCKVSNFAFEVRLEETQSLIKYFKELLESLNK